MRRQVLEPDTLQALLPLRAQAVARVAAKPEARAREQQFASVSPAYAQAAAAPDQFAANITVITLDSLTWSVPLLAPDDPEAVARYLKHQDFPYRAITQTREAGIGGAMIDIGANIGRMSISRLVLGDATLAYCIEPDPLNYACLVRNIRDNGLAGLALPDRLAIGAHNGTVRLERAKSPGGHRVLGEGMTTGRADGGGADLHARFLGGPRRHRSRHRAVREAGRSGWGSGRPQRRTARAGVPAHRLADRSGRSNA